jgi:hypothetical protein
MTKYYKAMFSNGRVETRSTASRTYTHAYLAMGTYEKAAVPRGPWDTGTWECKGWGGSEHRARTALASQVSYATGGGFRELTFSGLAEAVEITRKEYYEFRQGGRS